MFICDKCAQKCLNQQALDYPFWPGSYGPCEMCSKTANCIDVRSSLDWPWKTGGDNARVPV